MLNISILLILMTIITEKDVEKDFIYYVIYE